MSLADLTRPAVEEAIRQFDALGREVFLKRYGFRDARSYFIVHNGRRYDSKALAGVAHQYIPGMRALTYTEFKGGARDVAVRLRQLGFTVLGPGPALQMPYERGRIYNRERDIPDRFGGQKRGNIATPKGIPFVFLFTREAGEKYGYTDDWQRDGAFSYTGEGPSGDMKFIGGNLAIREHAANGKDLVLFEAQKEMGAYRFIGCFDCAGWEYQMMPGRDGKMRRGIVFHLVPSVPDDHAINAAADRSIADRPLQELRRLALNLTVEPTESPTESKRVHYRRSAIVKAYVLARAAGKCEACATVAPFVRPDGSAYLEPHHIMRVADGGLDHPSVVAAICPTCHRRIHYGAGGIEINENLRMKVADLENVMNKMQLQTDQTRTHFIRAFGPVAD